MRLLKYFTVWSLALVAAHETTHRHIHLPLLTLVTLVGGSLVTALVPSFRWGPVRLGTWTVRLGDVVLHQLPFYFVVWKYGGMYWTMDSRLARQQAWGVVWVWTLYLAMVDPCAQYGVSRRTLHRMLALAATAACAVLSAR